MSSVSELFALKPTIHVANTLQRGLGPCYVPECSRAKIPGYLAKPWHSWWIRPTSAKLASPSVWSSADKCRESSNPPKTCTARQQDSTPYVMEVCMPLLITRGRRRAHTPIARSTQWEARYGVGSVFRQTSRVGGTYIQRPDEVWCCTSMGSFQR